MNQSERLFALTHQFKAKRIDNDDWVTGCYFITPLTDENSGTLPECGWFFLTGEQRHCISTLNDTFDHTVFIIDPSTLEYIGLPVDITKEKSDERNFINKQICTAEGCNEISVRDYNGHGDYCCEYHWNKWNDEFDEEYK